MKVLFFCNLVPSKTGAFENLLTELGRVFRDGGDQLILGLAGDPIEEVASEWRRVALTWELLPGWTDAAGTEHPWAFCRPAFRLLKRHRPDVAVVHFGNELPSLVTSLLASFAGASRVKWVWQQDQRIADPTPLTAPLSRLRLLALTFDRFVAVYEGGRRSLMLRGVPEKRIWVIHNGVSAHPPTRDSGWLKRDLGLLEDALICVTVGSLIGRKRIDFQIEALARIGARGQDAHLVIVGDGPGRSSLKALAHARGVGPRVHFLGQRNDVPDVLLESDLLVHSATAEASSYAILESMAAGIPAVVTRAGAAGEQIADGGSGFVAGAAQIDEFVEKWGRLIQDEPLRLRMGEATMKRWQELYRVEDSARRYHELYRDLTTQSASSNSGYSSRYDRTVKAEP